MTQEGFMVDRLDSIDFDIPDNLLDEIQHNIEHISPCCKIQ